MTDSMSYASHGDRLDVRVVHPWPGTDRDDAEVGADRIRAAAFEMAASGLIVCDASAQVRHANCAGRAELASRRVLGVREATLYPVGRGRADLGRALTRAIDGAQASLLSLAHADQTLLIAVSPLVVEGAPPLALLLLGQRELCGRYGLEQLGETHKLSRTERRILGALISGAGPEEIANQGGVALSTVRTQISSIRMKFDAPSVKGLLMAAARVPPFLVP